MVRLLLVMTIEIWDRDCGPFQPIFAVFAILGQVGNTIFPWHKGSNQKRVAILVQYDQGTIALGICICSSGLAGVMQHTVRATLPNFAFFTVFCPDARPSPRETAGSQRDSKPNPDAWDQRDIKAPEWRPALTRSPRKPTRAGHPRWPILSIWASGPHVATPWRHDAWESREPNCIVPLESSYSNSIGLVAAPLPSYGPAEGSILNYFELKSRWAETAHFQPPTPRGYWRGHISDPARS